MNAAAIEIVPVKGKADLSRFIRLPALLHADDPCFVPPLELERQEAFSPRHNPYFEHAEVQFWLARRDGRDVGRISAQIDRLAQTAGSDKIGHFGLIAAVDDAAVFQALFATAEAWLRERGCRQLLGPFNLNINEETGLLVDGFDTPPMLMMGHDRPYIAAHIEALGYAKAKDLFAYLHDTTVDMPPAARRRIERAAPDGLTVRCMDSRRYLEEIRTAMAIFNEAWAHNWGFVPLTPAEVDHLAKAMKPILDPRLVAVAEWRGEPVGFGVCLPNINEAIRDLGGRLLPFGWAKLLWRLKVADVGTGRVPLMGVRRSASLGMRAGLIPFMVIDQMRQRALERGFRQIELSWILEDNLPMRHMTEAVGARAYKTYRVYQKALA